MIYGGVSFTPIILNLLELKGLPFQRSSEQGE